MKMTWREGGKVPRKMISFYSIVADSTTLYVRTESKQVYAFTASTSSWTQLPDSPTNSCPSVIINNLLTLVGGYHSLTITNQLFSLTGKGLGRKWRDKFPPIPTKREGSTALCTGTDLIVAGGNSETYSTLETVEVMNTETLQWSAAANLPQPLCRSRDSGAVCGDHVYILSLTRHSKSMYSCPESSLIQSCQSTPTADVWNKVAAPPVTDTACVSIFGQLLAIGGVDSNGKPTTAVHLYNPGTDSWEVISHMATSRYNCYAAVLPNNQVMVVGGMTVLQSGSYMYSATDSVELAIVEYIGNTP